MDSKQLIASRQLPVASEGRRLVASCQLPVASEARRATHHWQLTTGNSFRPRGFSFTEILFAVMILGIGFIMVAAMFPVGIQQTQANSNETIAASLGRAGDGYLDKVATAPWIAIPTRTTTSVLLPTFQRKAGTQIPANGQWQQSPAYFGAVPIPPNQLSLVIPGQVWSFHDARDGFIDVNNVNHRDYLWNLTAGNLIQPADPRFAWVCLYKRDLIATTPQLNSNAVTQSTSILAAPYAQVIMIGIQAGGRQAFDPAVDTAHSSNAPASLEPELFTSVVLIPPTVAGGATRLLFDPKSNINRLGEGAYAIVSDVLNLPGGLIDSRRALLIGRAFRIGINNGQPNDWQLRPGNDLTASDVVALNGKPLSGLEVLVVGRGYQDPKQAPPNLKFVGPTQDVAVYTTFVQIPN